MKCPIPPPSPTAPAARPRPATGSTIVALKRDSGLTAGGATDARFNGATVRTVNVADAGDLYLRRIPLDERRWRRRVADGDYTLYKFDLSSIPAGSTINLAQLRLYHTVGNGGAGNGDVSMVLTHAWSEGAGRLHLSRRDRRRELRPSQRHQHRPQPERHRRRHGPAADLGNGQRLRSSTSPWMPARPSPPPPPPPARAIM